MNVKFDNTVCLRFHRLSVITYSFRSGADISSLIPYNIKFVRRRFTKCAVFKEHAPPWHDVLMCPPKLRVGRVAQTI